MFKSVNLLRLNHGQEVIKELNRYCKRKGITSAVILGIIGSLEYIKFGLPPKDGSFGYSYDEYKGNVSILSGQGTLSTYNRKKFFHVHVVASDPLKPGYMIGGHVEEAIAWATVEIAIGELPYQLTRIKDKETGLTAVKTT